MKKALPQTIVYWLTQEGRLPGWFDALTNSYTFINAADYGDDILHTVCQVAPDYVLLEINYLAYERDVELIKRIRMWPKLPVKCIALVPFGVNWFAAVEQLDISGFISANHLSEELEACLSTLSEGYRFLSPHLLSSTLVTAQPVEVLGPLTSRENEVVHLIASGYTNKEIAEQLFVSVKTVEAHKMHVMQKLNLTSTSQLRQLAIQNEHLTKGTHLLISAKNQGRH